MFRKFLPIILSLAFAIALPLATEASAKSSFQLLPKSSLWSQIPQEASKDEIQAICDEMIARQDASAIGRMDASSLYMHGKIHGIACVKVDYYKALVLAKASGDAFTLKASLAYIKGKADSGVEKAIRALEKFAKEQ